MNWWVATLIQCGGLGVTSWLHALKAYTCNTDSGGWLGEVGWVGLMHSQRSTATRHTIFEQQELLTQDGSHTVSPSL